MLAKLMNLPIEGTSKDVVTLSDEDKSRIQLLGQISVNLGLHAVGSGSALNGTRLQTQRDQFQ